MIELILFTIAVIAAFFLGAVAGIRRMIEVGPKRKDGLYTPDDGDRFQISEGHSAVVFDQDGRPSNLWFAVVDDGSRSEFNTGECLSYAIFVASNDDHLGFLKLVNSMPCIQRLGDE